MGWGANDRGNGGRGEVTGVEAGDGACESGFSHIKSCHVLSYLMSSFIIGNSEILYIISHQFGFCIPFI